MGVGTGIDAALRQENLEGGDVVRDRVVDEDVAVISKLGRVRGEPEGIAVDDGEVATVDLLAVLVVRAETTLGRKEVVVLQRAFRALAHVTSRGRRLAAEKVAGKP